MSQPMTMKESRQRIVQLTTYEDGLWDILLGSIFLLLSIYPVTRELLGPELNFVFYLVVLLALVGVHFLARKYISEPRIGRVTMRPSRGTKAMLVVTVVLFFGTLGLVLLTLFSPVGVTLPETGALPGGGSLGSVDIAVGLVLVGIFSVLAYRFGVVRLYFYGALLGLASLVSAAGYLSEDGMLNIPLVVASGIILLTGFFLLGRFLARYPVPTSEGVG